jgi:esterase/lipase superfamily enzyme
MSPAQSLTRQAPAKPSPSFQRTTNLILIAPDIGTKEFMRMREAVLTRVRHITVYCGDDSVLGMSKRINNDDRLGYCVRERTTAEAVPGVDFVRVTGCGTSTWDNHSPHLNFPEAMEDIGRSLADAQEMGLPAPSRDREVRCIR